MNILIKNSLDLSNWEVGNLVDKKYSRSNSLVYFIRLGKFTGCQS